MAGFALPGRRRSARHRRINPRMIVAGCVALLVFIAAMVGYLLGQAGQSSHAITTGTGTATSSSPAATAPNLHTEQAAAAAAQADIEKMYGPDFVYADTRQAALADIADPAKLGTLRNQLNGQLQQWNAATHFDNIVKGGTPAVSVMRVITPPQTSGYNGRTAQVSMWCMDILGAAGGSPPRVGWNTATLTMAWTGGAWKVDAITLDTGPAPAPDLQGSPPTDASEFVAQVHQYQGVSK